MGIKIRILMFVFQKHAGMEHMDEAVIVHADTVKMGIVATIQTGRV